MSNKTIGRSLGHGFAGNYSIQPDAVITTQFVKGDNVTFGDPVMLNSDGTISVAGSSFDDDVFVGVATSEVRTGMFIDNMDGIYRDGNAASIMTRGVVTVICQKGNPAPGQPVYVRISNPPAGCKIGGFEAEADNANTVELPTCVWQTDADANKVADIRLKTINLI